MNCSHQRELAYDIDEENRVLLRYVKSCSGKCHLIGRVRLPHDEYNEASGKWVYYCYTCKKETLI